MRLALHSIVVDGKEADYDTTHRAIPDDLVEAFGRLGIHDWTIWRSGRDLFHLVEADDFEAALRALADEPADQRWQATIGPFVERFVTRGDDLPLLTVWDLQTQKTTTTKDEAAR